MKLNLLSIKNLFSKPLFILGVILTIGIFFRLFNLWNNITFIYDQARDAQRILDITTFKNFKLVGQESDIPGVFHGVLTYYLLAPIYFIGNYSPNFAAIFFALINLFGVLLLYFTSLVVFNSRKIGFVAGFFWAVSFEQANFSRYISNASLMSIATIIFFLGLAIFLFKKKDWGLILSGIGYGLCVQFNFSLVYFIFFYPILFLIFRPKLNKRTIALFISAILIMLSSFALAEIKNQFIMTKSLSSYILYYRGRFDFLGNGSRYVSRVYETLYYSFISFNKVILFSSFILFSLLAWKLIKNLNIKLFFFLWLFSSLPLFFFNSGILETQLINASFFAPLTLLIAYCITQLYTKGGIYQFIFVISIVAILASNINSFYQDSFRDIRILSTQNDTLADEERLIDYTYQSSGGKPFSICTLSNPLFVDTLWSYLYSWYGKNKYGYTPFWAGQEQVNGLNHLFYDKQHVPQRYLIIEPSIGVGGYAKQVFVYMEDNTSVLKEQKTFGDIVVQKRELNINLNSFVDTQNLLPKEINSIKSIIKDNPRFTCFNTYDKDI